MSYGPKKLSMKNRRGVSQIIGSLMILALVAAVGSVILFQGLNQINAFNYELTIHDTERNLALRENVLFEHVWFDLTGKNVTLYLANIGTTDTDIATVTMVKIDTQQLILREEILAGATIVLEDHIQLNVTANLPDALLVEEWQDEYYNDTDYKISITTSKGNFFDTVVKPPNT